jgi:hypothetical protein
MLSQVPACLIPVNHAFLSVCSPPSQMQPVQMDAVLSFACFGTRFLGMLSSLYIQVGSDVAAKTQAAASQTAEAAKEKASQAYGAAADTASRTQEAAKVRLHEHLVHDILLLSQCIGVCASYGSFLPVHLQQASSFLHPRSCPWCT